MDTDQNGYQLVEFFKTLGFLKKPWSLILGRG